MRALAKLGARSSALLASFLVLACGDDASLELPLPALSAETALAGAAPSGSALDPRLITRIALGTETVYRPEALPGTVVDAMVGGLSNADLAEGMTVDSLELVGPRADAARPLPPLRAPHIVARPAPSEELSGFVPVESEVLSSAEASARRQRLDRLLEGVYVRPPCIGDPEDFTVTVPRIPADTFLASRATDTEIWVGLVGTSTLAYLAFGPSGAEPELRGITVPSVGLTVTGRTVALRELGPPHPTSGLPSYVVASFIDTFGRAGLLLSLDASGRRYLDDTPFDAEVGPPRSLRAAVDLDLDGTPSRCALGGITGANQDAGLWCRTETSTVWSLELRSSLAQTFVGAHAEDGRLRVVDRAGSVFARTAGAWAQTAEAPINAGCRPACATFDVFAPTSAGDLVYAGNRAQLLTLAAGSGPTLGSGAPEAWTSAQIVDEREDGARALSVTALAPLPSPSGSSGGWLLGTARGLLFKASASFDAVERVCLPYDLADHVIGALAPAPDGRLVVGASDGVIAEARWDTWP